MYYGGFAAELLAEKARTRNPDEFYFKMVKATRIKVFSMMVMFYC